MFAVSVDNTQRQIRMRWMNKKHRITNTQSTEERYLYLFVGRNERECFSPIWMMMMCVFFFVIFGRIWYRRSVYVRNEFLYIGVLRIRAPFVVVAHEDGIGYYSSDLFWFICCTGGGG